MHSPGIDLVLLQPKVVDYEDVSIRNFWLKSMIKKSVSSVTLSCNQLEEYLERFQPNSQDSYKYTNSDKEM